MELDDALVLARATHQSVLTTVRRDGRPQLSNVMHTVDADGLIRISTTATRAKLRNLRRDPFAALHVNGPDFFSYAVLEGDVTLSEVAVRADDAVVDELVEVYRAVAGEHDDWDAYRAAMLEEQRVVVRLAPGRAYGMARLPETSGT